MSDAHEFGCDHRRELILYAVPSGPLADACQDYFDEATSTVGLTVAQTYPVHCTLTGFLRRPQAPASAIVDRVRALVEALGPVPDRAVEVSGLVVVPDWVGLELWSPWLRHITEQVVSDPVFADEADPPRTKDWLHVSLAYGIDDVSDHARLARARIDPSLSVEWSVELWEREADGRWLRHCTT